MPLANSSLRPRSRPPQETGMLMRRSLSTALGDDSEVPHAARILQLMDTRERLTEGEISELLRALVTPAEIGESRTLHATWFHEVANLIQRQDHDQRSFSEVLATVARDGERSRATRDYALQQLRRVWSKNPQDVNLRRAIEGTFVEMNASGHPMRATALLSLHMLDSLEPGSRGWKSLHDGIVSILDSPARHGAGAVSEQMAAARIAGERDMRNVRKPLMRIASMDGEHALVRMAAVAALGRMADPADLRALVNLSPSDQRVAEAIRHATASDGPQ
jgi:hypothetical protein